MSESKTKQKKPVLDAMGRPIPAWMLRPYEEGHGDPRPFTVSTYRAFRAGA